MQRNNAACSGKSVRIVSASGNHDGSAVRFVYLYRFRLSVSYFFIKYSESIQSA